MNNEWLSDARKIPGEAMNYIRKIAVRAIVEKEWSPELVIDIFGLSTSCIYEWLDRYRKGGYDALDTRYPPGMKPIVTKEMDVWLEKTVLSYEPTDFGYDSRLWTCDILAEILKDKFGIDVIGATVNAHPLKSSIIFMINSREYSDLPRISMPTSRSRMKREYT
jgi:transposase